MTYAVLQQAIQRPAQSRGQTRNDWLDSYHTFSFGDYYDPQHMGFSDLRVINDDTVAPGGGFATHGHKDMEIVTLVLSGELEHQDSLGNGSIIRPGDIQRMSAGTGIRHSEFNPSDSQPVHLLQIWILPEQLGLDPGYEQRNLSASMQPGQFQLLASRDGREGSVTVHQDMALYGARLQPGQTAEFLMRPDRRYWLHLATGEAALGEQHLSTGDALGVFPAGADMSLALTARQPDTYALLFDLKP